MSTVRKVSMMREALAILRDLKERRAEYEADVDRWYRSGDGRSVSRGGRGWSYPYCQHGVSRWTDYDCACGACEAGDEGLYAQALSEARRRAAEAARRAERVRAAEAILDGLERPINDDLRAQLIEAMSR